MIKKPQYTAQLTFLKLGGSLITDKATPRTPRLDVLSRLAQEIAEARAANPALQLLLGHGSGSFGHVPARKHGTRQGVRTPEQWRGFAEVWWDAASLNRLVVEALREAGLPVVSFPPSTSVTAQDGQVAAWDLTPLRLALEAGLLPVVQGDVIFDTIRGGTILSTEELFVYLAPQLRPARLLLAGIEPGVWSVYPPPLENGSGGGFRTRPYTAHNTQIPDGVIPEITPENISGILPALGGLAGHRCDRRNGEQSPPDAGTGAGAARAGGADLFWSKKPGLVREALLGAVEGTKIRV